MLKIENPQTFLFKYTNCFSYIKCHCSLLGGTTLYIVSQCTGVHLAPSVYFNNFAWKSVKLFLNWGVRYRRDDIRIMIML